MFSEGGGTHIADFVGDGLSVATATSPIDALTPTVVAIRPVVTSSMVTPNQVGFVGGARHRVFFGEPYKMVSLRWDASEDIEFSPVMSVPMFVTSHPQRDDAFFVDTAPETGVQSVWSVHSGQAPQLAIGPMPLEFVTSLAVSPSGVVALVADTREAPTVWNLVRPGLTSGVGVYELVARLVDPPASNVVMDGDAAIVAEYDGASRRIVVSRYAGVNMASGEGALIGALSVSTPATFVPDVHLDVDDGWVYLAHADTPECLSPTCSHSFDVVRFKTDGSSANDPPPAVLKTFQGPSGTRPFDVDACYFIWNDAAADAPASPAEGVALSAPPAFTLPPESVGAG